MLKKQKLSELENKILDVSSWSTKTALSAVENKISNVRGLVNKANHDIKISEIEKKHTDPNHDKYITTPELAVDAFNTRSAKRNLIKMQILILYCRVSIIKLLKINHKMCLLKIN